MLGRAWLALALVVIPLSGCSGGDDDCAPLRGHGVVQAVSGRDVHILMDDGQPAVLHLSSDVHVLEDGRCSLTGPGGVRVEDHITFEVDAWAESYPMQGWPERAVVVR